MDALKQSLKARASAKRNARPDRPAAPPAKIASLSVAPAKAVELAFETRQCPKAGSTE